MEGFTIECKDSYTGKNSSLHSRFEIGPLERGQATTLGNALRRVLLANLEGAAITSVRIAGINHEFCPIPGVREDVLDLMLNLKEVVLRSYSNDPPPCRLLARGPATVRAGDFEVPADVEIVHPDQYIATLAEGAVLEMECKVERGKGYRTVDRSKEAQYSSIDYLQLDAAFMPVRKVQYEIKEHTGGGKYYETLSLEVATNGSITPQVALSEAASILVGLFAPLQEITLVQSKSDEPEPQNEHEQTPIEELHLSVRAYCLKRATINTIADLLRYSQEDLLEIKNFGQKSADEVIEALQARLGLTLPETKQKVSS
ncbi:MAG: DNA-directed RNA polymerase subunit alpha [Pseudanabaenaceae cyanobacterium]